MSDSNEVNDRNRQGSAEVVIKNDGKDVTVEDKDGVAARAQAAGRKFVPWYLRAGLKKGRGKGSGKAQGAKGKSSKGDNSKGKYTKGDKDKGKHSKSDKDKNFVPWYLRAGLKKKGKDSGKGKGQSGSGRGKGRT